MIGVEIHRIDPDLSHVKQRAFHRHDDNIRLHSCDSTGWTLVDWMGGRGSWRQCVRAETESAFGIT